jgi:hypothetical protein
MVGHFNIEFLINFPINLKRNLILTVQKPSTSRRTLCNLFDFRILMLRILSFMVHVTVLLVSTVKHWMVGWLITDELERSRKRQTRQLSWYTSGGTDINHKPLWGQQVSRLKVKLVVSHTEVTSVATWAKLLGHFWYCLRHVSGIHKTTLNSSWSHAKARKQAPELWCGFTFEPGRELCKSTKNMLKSSLGNKILAQEAEIKVSLSLYLIKQHAMKTHGGSGGTARHINLDTWCCFIPWERASGTHCRAGWAGSTANLNALGKREILLPLLGIYLWFRGYPAHRLAVVLNDASRLHDLRGLISISTYNDAQDEYNCFRQEI